MLYLLWRTRLKAGQTTLYPGCCRSEHWEWDHFILRDVPLSWKHLHYSNISFVSRAPSKVQHIWNDQGLWTQHHVVVAPEVLKSHATTKEKTFNQSQRSYCVLLAELHTYYNPAYLFILFFLFHLKVKTATSPGALDTHKKHIKTKRAERSGMMC